MRRRKDLLHELGQVEGELEQIGSVQQRRAEAVKALRNSVKWVGDVESSVNVDWDAEQ